MCLLEVWKEVFPMKRIFSTPLAFCFLAVATPTMLRAWGELTITLGPPPIPIYEQPMCPQDGYNWTPGYWAYGDAGYFWVPGTWLLAPAPGLLWTPGYWGWGNQSYAFHEGYWGPQVGFYGGVNYGYGYGGSGFQGGYWQGQVFFYNRSVAAVGPAGFTHVYRQPVPANHSQVAFNGGTGGLRAAPTAQDRKAERDPHTPPTGEQNHHHQAASQDRTLLATANHGHPPVAATAKAGDLAPGHGTPAKAAGGQRSAPFRPQAPAAAPQPHVSARPQVSAPPRPTLRPTPQAPAPPRAMPRPAPSMHLPAPPQSRPAPPQEPHAAPTARPAPQREEHHK
jgi:hypothetical protein